MITVKELPYPFDALEPHIDAKTVELHYSKHHQWYADKLNNAIKGTEYENMSLEEIIKNAEWWIFNNAAQVWNHTFYWDTLWATDEEANYESLEVVKKIEETWWDLEAFVNDFLHAATTNFGSGRTWLVKDVDWNLEILNTSNADTPIKSDEHIPLLTVDVWEHAYYLKYQNRRPEYLENIMDLINWDVVEERFQS